MVSRNCDGILVSPMREEEPRDTTVMVSLAIVIGASVVFIVLLLAVVSLAFYRWDLDTMQLELSTKFSKVSQYLEKARATACPLFMMPLIVLSHFGIYGDTMLNRHLNTMDAKIGTLSYLQN